MSTNPFTPPALFTRAPRIDFQIDIRLTVTLDIEADHIRSEPATRSHPGEKGGYWPVVVMLGDVDITKELSAETLEEIAEKINEDAVDD